MSETTTIDLTKFCGSSSRYDIESPWCERGFQYATDGHICIRVPSTGEHDKYGKRPPAEDCFNRFTTHDLEPWPKRKRVATIAGSSQPVGNGYVSDSYDNLIRELPNVRFDASLVLGPIYFRFDGGEGLIAVVDPKYVKREESR